MAVTPVYSQRFIEALNLVGAMDYTVPAGFRAVFKCIDVVDKTGVLGTVFQAGGAIGQTWALWTTQGLAGPGSFQWTGSQVFFPGDVVSMNVSGDPCDVTASGFLLTLP